MNNMTADYYKVFFKQKLDNITVALFSITMAFTFCGLFILPEGRSWASTLFFITVIFGVVNHFINNPKNIGIGDKLLIYVLLGYALMLSMNKIIHDDSWSIIRTLLYVSVFGLLIPRRTIILDIAKYSVFIGSILLGALTYQQVDSGVYRVDGYTNAILFSQAALALILLSFFIGFEQPSSKSIKIFAVTSICFSLYALYMSQSRGVWLALLICIIIYIASKFKNDLKKGSVLLFIILLGSVLFYQQSSVLQSRVKQGISDLEKAQSGMYNTSWGLRIVAWQAAWQGFLTSPIIGVGHDGFVETKQLLVTQGKVPQVLLDAKLSHSHNQFMQNLFVRGLFGFAALIILYFQHLYFGYKIRGCGSVSFILPVGFIVCSLSDVPLEHRNVIFLYVMSLFYLWISHSSSIDEDKIAAHKQI